MAGVARKVWNGSLLLAGSKLLGNFASLLSTLVLARLLVPDDFGLVAIGASVLALAKAMTNLSLGQALIHHEDPQRDHIDSVFVMNLVRGLLIASAIFLLAPWIADFYEDERLEFLVAVIGSSMVITGLLNPKLAMLKRELQFSQEFAFRLARDVGTAAISIGFAIYYKSYFALVAGIIGGEISAVLVSYIIVPYLPRFRVNKIPELLGFSGWLGLSEIVQTLNARLDPLIVGSILGPYSLGLITVASSFANIPSREMLQPLNVTLFPAFRHLRDEPERMRRAYQTAQSLIVAISLPVAVAMALMAGPLVKLALGDKWIEATIVLQVLAVTLGFQTVGSQGRSIAAALGQTRLIFRRSYQALVFRIPIMIAGLYYGGLLGFLAARAVLAVLSVLMDTWLVQQAAGIPIKQQIFSNWRTFVNCAATAVIVWLIDPLMTFAENTFGYVFHIAVLGTLTAAIYLPIAAFLWVISGRPEGPETTFLGMLRKGIAWIASRVRRQKA